MILEQMVMNLVLAINEKDLEKTKQTVNLINNLNPDEISMGSLNSMLNLDYAGSNFIDYLNNDCLDYMLLNMRYLYRAQEIYLNKIRLKLIKNDNNKMIEDFIQQQLSKPTFSVESNILAQNLISLVINLKDKNKISFYFEQINKILEQG